MRAGSPRASRRSRARIRRTPSDAAFVASERGEGGALARTRRCREAAKPLPDRRMSAREPLPPRAHSRRRVTSPGVRLRDESVNTFDIRAPEFWDRKDVDG